MKYKDRYEIINNKIELTNVIHPLFNIKNKAEFIAEFCKDSGFDKYEIIYNSKNDAQLVKIDYNNNYFFVYIDSVDGGGKDGPTSKKPNKKISIPFSKKTFVEKILDGNSVYVINFYNPLIEKDGIIQIDKENKVYMIVNKNEVYSSSIFKNLKNDNKVNDTNRWVSLEEIFEVINKKNDLTVTNKAKNIHIIHKSKIEDFFCNTFIDENDHPSNWIEESRNVKMELTNQSTKKVKFDQKSLESLRTQFRKNLTNRIIKEKCEISTCNINYLDSLIASHIIAVQDILKDDTLTDEEKMNLILSPDNGLLLCRNHDYLFDKKIISFKDDGLILIDNNRKNELSCFQLNKNSSKISHISEKKKKNLQNHRKIWSKKIDGK